jgi:AcrR family transcriptional regulator
MTHQDRSEINALPGEPAVHSADSLTQPVIYSSQAIIQRRKRILREARRLIAERGIEGFTIRTLCDRADVAPRTLYNAFLNKERLIAIAIQDAYEDFNRKMKYKTAADTLVGMLDRLMTVNRRNFNARNYTRAVAALYFSGTTHHDIWEALQQMAFANLKPWLARLDREDLLEPWVDTAEIASTFANIEYSTINDWAQGRIANADYLGRLVGNFLTLVVGIARGEVLEEARRHLATLHETGGLFDISGE